jgi:predicted ATPase
MIIMTKSNIGSYWSKWDLHVHTPASVLLNGFGNDWDKYVSELFKKAIKENIMVIGITDYFSIEGYKKIRNEYLSIDTKLNELFSTEEVEYIKSMLIIPNIEFRLNRFVGKERINFHVLFSNEISINEIEESFLHDLDFVYDAAPFNKDEKKKLKLSNLESLGKKLQEDHPNFRDQTEIFTGMMNAVVDDIQISDILDSKRSIFSSKYLLAIPCDEDLSDVSWNGQDHQARKVLIQKSNLLMASNPNTIKWGLGQKSESPEAYIQEFKSLKPCVFGSDAHNYAELFVKNKPRLTWIKAELSFDGLLQILHEPSRVFIGEIPEILKRVNTNPTKYIKSLSVDKKSNSSIPDVWFDSFKVDLNPALVAIIGNKGKGKSAISDILGLCGNAHIAEEDFSFLHKSKFRNPKPNYAKEYIAKINWEAGAAESKSLDTLADNLTPERVKYIPQSFLEKLCTSVDKKVFEEELEKVIYSRLEEHQKLGKGSLREVLSEKKQSLENRITQVKSEIYIKNEEIVELERKNSSEYRESIDRQIQTKQNELKVHNDTRPPAKNNPDDNEEVRIKSEKTIKQIEEQRESIKKQMEHKEALNNDRNRFTKELTELKSIKDDFTQLNVYIDGIILKNVNLLEKYEIKKEEIIQTSIEVRKIEELILDKAADLNAQELYFTDNHQLNPDTIILKAENRIDELQNELDGETKEYQQYLSNLQDWENRKNEIIGSVEKEGSLNYLEEIKNYLHTVIESKLNERYNVRKSLLYKILKLKKDIADVYKELYQPVSEFILQNRNVLSDYNVNIDVALEINEFQNKFFGYVANNVSGSFYGSSESRLTLQKISDVIDFDDIESVSGWVEEIISHLSFDKREGQNGIQIRSLKSQLKGGFTEKDFYGFLFSMDFYEPTFQLKLGSKTLSELSPGERGALLLIFYLLLDKQDIPIIIDQPEENLDNQSVYNILVHFIKKAKERRQIIIVTHNPNLAVVCDAEQIIRMDIAKDDKNRVSMITGGIENQEINQAIVDVLEGTRPAFNNRTSKYQVSNN